MRVFFVFLEELMNPIHVLNNQSVMFIGGGNMASALIEGLLQAKQAHQLSLDIRVSDPKQSAVDSFLAKGVNAVLATQADTLIASSSVVVLAVKPQVMAEVCQSIRPYLADKLIISIAAGLTVDSLANMVGHTRIVRTMPNLPATVGMGATGLFAKEILATDRSLALAIMSASGMGVWVDKEDDLHTVTAVAGSAPAYFFYMLEQMIAKAVEMGLDKVAAHHLAVQTMQGAAMMAKTGDPATLRAKVTSKGGTTHAAITYFDTHEVDTHIKGAMQACADRSMALALG